MPTTTDLYRRFSEELLATGAIGEIMPYDWTSLHDPLEGIWMVYSMMLDDFARELSNAINGFTLNVRRLRAWETLLPKLTDDERSEALHEFVEPVATLCLLTPYMIRSRFIFSTAHLCHQVNLIREAGWHEASLPVDDEIYIDSACVQGKRWRRYSRLQTRLEAIGGKALRAATADFRNAFSHRFSARVGFGLTNFVTRNLDVATGKVVYIFGGTPALELADLSTLLIAELSKCYAAYPAFRALVAEHVAFIEPYNAKVRAAREAASIASWELAALGDGASEEA